MQITTIPNVLVNGQNVYPYSVDFTYGGSEVSEVTLKFVNKNGNYAVPETNSLLPVKIKIGNFHSMDAYVVETNETSTTNGGDILTVSYVDSSIILDKTVIGLRGIHGPGFSTTAAGNFSPNLILVGKQIDPCDSIPKTYPDPCAPVCEETGNRQDFDCTKEKLLKILQVDYSFPELRTALSSKVSFGNFPDSINSLYRANYTGNLREVLQSWCADFGIGFYWASNAVYFYDLSSGITINDSGLDTGQNVMNYSETKSIRGNSSRAKVVYFGADGEEREYSCTADTSKLLTLSAITLYDLLADSKFNGTISPTDLYLREKYDPQNKNSVVALSTFYDCIILSNYSDTLRDLYLLYVKNGLISEAATQAWITARKKPIPCLGDLRPLSIFTKTTTNIKYYNKFLQLLKTADEQVEFESKGGYFVLAEWNEDTQRGFEKMELSLAENFLGKYWIRKFSQGTKYSFDAPDGNVSYYSGGSVIQFPFINDLPDNIQRASDFLQDVITGAEIDSSGNIISTSSQGQFLMMERTPIWSPSRDSNTIKDLIKTVEPFKWSISDFSDKDIQGLDLVSLGYDSGTIFKNKLVVFKAYPQPSNFDLEITKSEEQTGPNPIDSKNTGLSTELNGSNVSYGLRSALTSYFIIKSNGNNIQIHAPSQAGLTFGRNYGGYVIIANGTTFTNNTTVVIPKKESILGDFIEQSQNDVTSELDFKDATQNLVKYLESSGTATCGYDDAQINNLLLNFNSRQRMFPSVQKIIKNYEISGIPATRFTPADGLSSFSISVGDSGVRTSVSFSNVPMRHKSDTSIEKKFEEDAVTKGKAKNYFRQK